MNDNERLIEVFSTNKRHWENLRLDFLRRTHTTFPGKQRRRKGESSSKRRWREKLFFQKKEGKERTRRERDRKSIEKEKPIGTKRLVNQVENQQWLSSRSVVEKERRDIRVSPASLIICRFRIDHSRFHERSSSRKKFLPVCTSMLIKVKWIESNRSEQRETEKQQRQRERGEREGHWWHLPLIFSHFRFDLERLIPFDIFLKATISCRTSFVNNSFLCSSIWRFWDRLIMEKKEREREGSWDFSDVIGRCLPIH